MAIKPSHIRGFALAVVAAAALAGCGSSSNETVSAEPSAAEGPISGEVVVKSSDPVGKEEGSHYASYPTGPDNDELSPTGAQPVEFCDLVSQSKAEAILGETVQATENPQGPTCVFAGSKREASLVVEDASFAVLRSNAQKAAPVQVAGQTGWCLRYESTSVVVPLGDGRVLQVTGPCDVATRFAALVLPRIPS